MLGHLVIFWQAEGSLECVVGLTGGGVGGGVGFDQLSGGVDFL
jgi:hypothetical protein